MQGLSSRLPGSDTGPWAIWLFILWVQKTATRNTQEAARGQLLDSVVHKSLPIGDGKFRYT